MLANVAPAAGAPAAPGGAEQTAQRLGVQLVPKHKAGKSANAFSDPRHGANPLIALLPDPSRSDFAYWKSALAQQSAKRAAKRKPTAALQVEPLLVDELEPDALRGGNDHPANAELIPAFGSAAGQRSAARILGTLAPSAAAAEFDAPPEDNGAIPLARETGIRTGVAVLQPPRSATARTASAGDRTRRLRLLQASRASAGQRSRSTSTRRQRRSTRSSCSTTPPGTSIAFNDDAAAGYDSLLLQRLPADGDYYVWSRATSPVPEDPFDSGSGTAPGRGRLRREARRWTADDGRTTRSTCAPGDVLGGSVCGAGTHVRVRPGRARGPRLAQDASCHLPGELAAAGRRQRRGRPRGRAQRLALRRRASAAAGSYDVTLEVYRPGLETPRRRADALPRLRRGAAEHGHLRRPGRAARSRPLSAFLGRWGCPGGARERAASTDHRHGAGERAPRPGAAAARRRSRILNSRDDADPFGQPNVSRVIVGGTIDESGVADHRHRPVDRPGQLRHGGDRAGPAGRAVRAGG